jgi:hypothetical protein
MPELEPPYGVIANQLCAGNVVPFLGAGASMMGRPADPSWEWDPKEGKILPSGADLAKFLAKQATFPSETDHERTDLARVSSYFAEVSGRPALRMQLRELLGSSYQPSALHKLLAELPGHHVFVVSNYDTLLEQQFDALGKPYDLVYYPADNRKLAGSMLWWKHGAPQPEKVLTNAVPVQLGETTVIYKMHGTVLRGRPPGLLDEAASSYDSFVITEEDYVEFLYRMTQKRAIPIVLSNWFQERSFLFLGYSLRDWNLRVLLRNLQLSRASRQAGPQGKDPVPSWAIQYGPSRLEEKLWDGRGVHIFNQDLTVFTQKMRDELVRSGRIQP